MTLPADSINGKSKIIYVIPIIVVIIIGVIGVDLYNKLQQPQQDEYIEIVEREIRTWQVNLALCNSIESTTELLEHMDIIQYDDEISTTLIESIPRNKITSGIENRILELSSLIDKNTLCIISKSDTYQ